MLFAHEKKARWYFWMKDMEIPLDFVWIDDNRIVQINKDLQPPPPLGLISPLEAVNYVLEIPAGSLAANGLATTSRAINTFNPLAEEEEN